MPADRCRCASRRRRERGIGRSVNAKAQPTRTRRARASDQHYSLQPCRLAGFAHPNPYAALRESGTHDAGAAGQCLSAHTMPSASAPATARKIKAGTSKPLRTEHNEASALPPPPAHSHAAEPSRALFRRRPARATPTRCRCSRTKALRRARASHAPPRRRARLTRPRTRTRPLAPALGRARVAGAQHRRFMRCVTGCLSCSRSLRAGWARSLAPSW